MAGLKEIRRRITSVKNTKQITRAMKLVSAAKLRRAQDAAVFGRAYVKQLARTLEKIASELPEGFTHPLLGSGDEVTRRRVIIVAGERGLCGAYNSTVLKTVLLKEGRANDGLQRDFVCVGRRAVSFAKRQGWDIAGVFEGMPEEAARLPVAEIVESVVRDFLNGDIGEVVVYFTEFRSAMSQEVRCIPLLPFASESRAGDETSANTGAAGQVAFDSPAADIFAETIPLVIHSSLQQCILESKASEHASRMTAMDSATNNANDLIDKLRLFYNRARQSAITTELIDIVGGAEAAQS